MASAQEIFSRFDSMDPVAPAELFAENATLTLGNGQPWVGRDAIVAGSTAFLTSIASLRHRLLNEWTVGQDRIAEAAVTYKRHDGSDVTIPGVSIWRVGADGLIVDYRVFADLAPVFAASGAHRE